MKFSSNLLRLPALAAVALSLASCGFENAVVSLNYDPKLTQGIDGPAVLTVGRFADSRRDMGEYNLGTVRSAVGTPMESVITRVPVETIVRNAFMHALSARKMLTSRGQARYIITGEVLELQCEQVLRPSAFARVRVNLVKPGSGSIIFSRVFEGERQSGIYIPGTGSPVPKLGELTSRALQSAVDRALDDEQFRARLNGSRY